MQNKQLIITSPMPVSCNHYIAYRGILKGGKALAVSYKVPDAVKYQREFKQTVIDAATAQDWFAERDPKQHYYVDGIFYMPRFDMDPSNYWKILLDAITETQVVWVDDNVVCERVQGIFYDSANPRIELNIHPVEYIGIFEDASHLAEFESKCTGCNRYKRNCSILRNAKDGKIQEEITNNVCSRYSEHK